MPTLLFAVHVYVPRSSKVTLVTVSSPNAVPSLSRSTRYLTVLLSSEVDAMSSVVFPVKSVNAHVISCSGLAIASHEKLALRPSLMTN